MPVKYLKAPLQLKANGPEGSVQALFSVFNMLDSDGDVVLSSFFQDGQEIPMASWGHDWNALPPGKGVIHVTQDGAVFDGEFFLDTTHGKDHYTTVKRLGGLQEWSFGFKVLEAQRGDFNGQPARFLRKGETFEASPVLVGANRETRTLGIKGRRPGKQYYTDLEPPEGSFEDLAEDIAEAFQAQGYAAADCSVQTVATFPDGTAYVCVCDPQLPEPTYWRVLYDVGPDGDPTITGLTMVEASLAFAPVDQQQTGLSYAGDAARTLAVFSRFVTRTKALAAMRAKEGRTFSAANVSRMQTIMSSVRDAMDEMERMLGAAAPQKSSPGAALWREYLRTEQRLLALEEIR